MGSSLELDLPCETEGRAARRDRARQTAVRRFDACLAFMDSVRGGAPYPIDGREARKPVELIERIYLDAASQARPFLVK